MSENEIKLTTNIISEEVKMKTIKDAIIPPNAHESIFSSDIGHFNTKCLLKNYLFPNQ